MFFSSLLFTIIQVYSSNLNFLSGINFTNILWAAYVLIFLYQNITKAKL